LRKGPGGEYGDYELAALPEQKIGLAPVSTLASVRRGFPFIAQDKSAYGVPKPEERGNPEIKIRQLQS
jgi:hypothetical protein